MILHSPTNTILVEIQLSDSMDLMKWLQFSPSTNKRRTNKSDKCMTTESGNVPLRKQQKHMQMIDRQTDKADRVDRQTKEWRMTDKGVEARMEDALWHKILE